MENIKKLKEELEYKCEICERVPIRFNIHHLNGNHKDNRDENISLLCIDCHRGLHQRKVPSFLEDKQKLLNNFRRFNLTLRRKDLNMLNLKDIILI